MITTTSAWNTDRARRYGPDDGFEPGDAPDRWGDLERGESRIAPELTWYEIPEATVGDYGGYGAVGEANYRTLSALLESIDPDGEHHTVVNGMHSSRMLLVRGDCPDPDGELAEALDSLAGYPILDESEWSEVEHEWAEMAWDDYGRRDLAAALEPELGDDPSDAWLDTLWSVACALSDSGENWRDECASETLLLNIEDYSETLRTKVPEILRWARDGRAINWDEIRTLHRYL